MKNKSQNRSQLTNPRSGVKVHINLDGNRQNEQKSHLSGGSFARLRRCSSVTARCGDAPCVTPRIQPKSLTAPSAPIYEMASGENVVNNRMPLRSPLDDWWERLGPNSKMFVQALTHMVEAMGSDQQMGVGKQRGYIVVGWLDAPKRVEMMPLMSFQGSVAGPEGLGGGRW